MKFHPFVRSRLTHIVGFPFEHLSLKVASSDRKQQKPVQSARGNKGANGRHRVNIVTAGMLLLLVQSFIVPLSYAQTVDYSSCPACTSEDIRLITEVETKYLGIQGNNPKAPSTYGLVGDNKFNGTLGYGGVFDLFNGDNWLPIRREKQNFCGKLESFGIAQYGDENDWNIHLVPNPGFETFIQDAIPYKKANWHGASDDWAVASNGQYTIEAEITPDQSRYGNPWFPNSKLTPLLGKSIGVYGPFVREESHGNRPEIHPSELIWWKENGEKTIVLMITDDSNRFDDNDRPGPGQIANGDYTLRNVTDPNWVAWTLEKDQQEEISIPFQVNVASEVMYLSIHALDALHFSQNAVDQDATPGSKHTLTYQGASVLTVEETSSLDPFTSINFKNVCFDNAKKTLQGYVVLSTFIGNGSKKEGFVALQIEKKKVGATDKRAIVVGDLLGTWKTHAFYDDRFAFPDVLSSDQFGRGIVDGFMDFNGNGKTDLFVRANTTEWMTLYDGKGQWQVLGGSSFPLSSLRFGDVNGDRKTDILLNNGGMLQISYGGTQFWTKIKEIGKGDFQVADFNGDGKTDIVRMEITVSNSVYRGTMKIMWGGRGDWKTLQGGFNLTSATDYANNFRFGDFNGDGVSDLFRYSNQKFLVYWNGTGDAKELQRLNFNLASTNNLMFVKSLTSLKRTDVIYVNPVTKQWTYHYGGQPGSIPITVKYSDPSTVRFGDLDTDLVSEPFTVDFVKTNQRPEEIPLPTVPPVALQSVTRTGYQAGSLRRAASGNGLAVDLVLQRFPGTHAKQELFTVGNVRESRGSQELAYTPFSAVDSSDNEAYAIGLIREVPIGKEENNLIINAGDLRVAPTRHEIPSYTIAAMTATSNETTGQVGSWEPWNKFITSNLDVEFNSIATAVPASIETVNSIEFELFPFYSTLDEGKVSITDNAEFVKELNEIVHGNDSTRVTELFGSTTPFNITWSFELVDKTTGTIVPIDSSSLKISDGRFANSKVTFTFPNGDPSSLQSGSNALPNVDSVSLQSGSNALPDGSPVLFQLRAKAQVTDALGNQLARTDPFDFWNQRVRFENPEETKSWLQGVRSTGGRNYAYLEKRAKYFAEDNLLKPEELLEVFGKKSTNNLSKGEQLSQGRVQAGAESQRSKASAEKSAAARLWQNEPNPFGQFTRIRYFIPETATSAQLKVFSMKGQEVYSKALAGKGQGEVQLSHATFAAGTYVYHLIVDGQSVDSKKLILNR